MNDLIPDGWRIENIETIANVGSSKRILQSEYVPSGVPFFRSKEAIRRSKNLPIENPLYISKKRFKELKDKHGAPKKNEILVTAVGTIGVIYLIEDIEFYFKDGNLLWIKHIDEDVNPSYLAKYLASDTCHNAIIEIAGGSSQSALTIEKLSKLEFNLPPLPEQQKIAAILSSVDEVIEKTQAQINKLKDLKTGMMQELLSPREGQAAIINNPQCESKNGLHHTEFKDSPLGRIPVGWEVVTLEQICDQDAPITYGVLKPGNYVKGGKPLLQIKDLAAGTISSNDLHKISDELDYEYRRSRVKTGDIVISLVGTIGRIAIIPEWLKEPNIHRNLGRLRTKYNEFVFQFLQSELAGKQLGLSSAGSSQSALNLSALRQMLLPMPEDKEAQKITSILSSVDMRIEMTKKKHLQYQQIKKALMQDLLTGKVRVKVDTA